MFFPFPFLLHPFFFFHFPLFHFPLMHLRTHLVSSFSLRDPYCVPYCFGTARVQCHTVPYSVSTGYSTQECYRSKPSDSLIFACYLALHCLRGAATLSTPLKKNICLGLRGSSPTACLLCLLCLVDRLPVPALECFPPCPLVNLPYHTYPTCALPQPSCVCLAPLSLCNQQP